VGRLLKWAVFLAIIGVMIAPVPTSSKFLTLIFALILLVYWLKGAFVRWIKSDGKAPAWDEIKSVPPIVPEPPLKKPGPIGSAPGDFFAKWTLNRKNKNDPLYLNAMGEMFDIGTKHTPKNPVEAMRWYRAAVGGDPATAHGPHYSKLRIAEMYEDGEGVPRDLDMAGRIYKTIPNYPSAMLHFAISYVEGRGVPRDYVEAYKLVLLADKFLSWHASTRKEVEVNPQSHRANHRHIRAQELMALLEPRMAPEQVLKAKEAAREWWNAHR
jgi:Sel1 repeat